MFGTQPHILAELVRCNTAGINTASACAERASEARQSVTGRIDPSDYGFLIPHAEDD